jgi:peptidoglycan/LPS O-acetylase OafA/YrhL
MTSTNNKEKSTPPSIEWIASLRGVLVFLVFFSHQTELPVPKDAMFILGRIGVAGFFLVSGYLAVTSLQRRTAKQFLFNRFLRLYPIFWLILVLSYLLSPHCGLKELLWNATLFEEFVGYEAFLGASWMLPIMVVFFLLLTLITKRLGGGYATSCISDTYRKFGNRNAALCHG